MYSVPRKVVLNKRGTTTSSKERKLRLRKEAKERKRLAQKWKEGKVGSPRKILGPVIEGPETTYVITCMACGKDLTDHIMTSVLGKMVGGFIHKHIDHAGERTYITSKGSLIDVPLYDDHHTPRVITGRVCSNPDCIAQLTEILEDPINRPNEVYTDQSTIGFSFD